MTRTLGSTLVVLGALCAACMDQPAAPENLANRPSFTFTNNPDNGNPRIVRFEDVFGVLLVDPVTNLFSLQAATDRQFGCNESPELFTFQDLQQIIHNPDDPIADKIEELVLGKGVYIAVFEGFDEWEASGEDCADLFSRKLAEGVGNYVSTDNDLLTFLRENSNHNAFGFRAQGVLDAVAGGQVTYNGVSHCVWDGEDFETLKCKDRINFE